VLCSGTRSDTHLIETVFGCNGVVSPDGDVVFETVNARVRLSERPALSGVDPKATGKSGEGLRGMGVVFSVDDLAVTATVLAANGVSSAEAGGRLVVPAAPGQGVDFAFEEKR
jgi:hypothetical protein